MHIPDEILNDLRTAVFSAQFSHMRLFENFLDEIRDLFEIVPGDESDEVLSRQLDVAISEAIAALFRAMESWPALTDNDRLSAAFRSLEQQGMIAFGPAGFTLSDVHTHVTNRGLALEERGWGPSGYCSFHDQDVQRALEGGGLMLAFGTSREDTTDADCSEVGRRVVEAMTRVGLKVDWDGSPGTRIALPAFIWRARPRRMSSELLAEFLAGWELFLKSDRDAWSSSDSLWETLVDHASDFFRDVIDFGPAVLAHLFAHTQAFEANERAREAGWTEATMNDRLEGAFRELEGVGIAVNAGMGATLQDAWGYVGIHMREAPGTWHGAILYHDEDVIDAVNGRGFHLAFGTFEADPDRRTRAILDVAQTAVKVLLAHGLPARWSGVAHERIAISPFEWQYRRFTEPMPYSRAGGGGGILKRWLGAVRERQQPMAPTAVDPSVFAALTREFVTAGHAILVRAGRVTSGFDMERSRAIRAAFEQHSGGLPGHVCHLGVPYAFVPMDNYVMLGAMPAIENITDAAEVFRKRGAGISS